MLQDATFWTAVGLLILVAGIARPVWRSIASGLDARAERIKSTLDEANKVREEAQHLLAEYQRKQRNAAAETREIVERAKTDAARMVERASADLDSALGRREQLAIEKIAQAEAEAIREVRELSVDLAISAARSMIAQKLDDSRRNQLVNESISDLAGRLH